MFNWLKDLLLGPKVHIITIPASTIWTDRNNAKDYYSFVCYKRRNKRYVSICSTGNYAKYHSKYATIVQPWLEGDSTILVDYCRQNSIEPSKALLEDAGISSYEKKEPCRVLEFSK